MNNKRELLRLLFLLVRPVKKLFLFGKGPSKNSSRVGVCEKVN